MKTKELAAEAAEQIAERIRVILEEELIAFSKTVCRVIIANLTEISDGPSKKRKATPAAKKRTNRSGKKKASAFSEGTSRSARLVELLEAGPKNAGVLQETLGVKRSYLHQAVSTARKKELAGTGLTIAYDKEIDTYELRKE